MKLTENLVIETNRFKGVYWLSEFLQIEDNKITVFKGFEWNGMTWFFDGDKNEDGFPSGRVGSCVHDATNTAYRFLSNGVGIRLNLSNEVKDLILYDELVKAKYRVCKIPMSKIAYLGAKKFGKFFKS